MKCAACGVKKILLDGEEYWEDARPRLKRCPVCKESKTFQVRAGFLRRENGDVRWVYIGERCTACGTLGSYPPGCPRSSIFWIGRSRQLLRTRKFAKCSVYKRVAAPQGFWRCTACGTLGSFLDWKVDYSPTGEMEKNL